MYAEDASYSDHLFLWLRVQAVQALPGIDEIIMFDQELFILEPVQCISDSTGRQGGLTDEILLRQLTARFQHFIHELCRWRQVPDPCERSFIRAYVVFDKNDAS